MGAGRYLLLIVILIVAILTIPTVIAVKQGQVPLLAVSQLPDGTSQGDVATLHLEVRSGEGRVFLDTFPLTKVGTQISMRFAQQIACKHLDIDCNKYDFIYTIRANSGIVAGPSAGAAATVLTIAVLNDIELNQFVSMTGTINSGGFVGSVSSVKEKIDTAHAAGITTVLIPAGNRYHKTEPHVINTTGITDPNISPITEIASKTIDLVEYGKKKNMDIIEVYDLQDAWFYFTGEKPKIKNKELAIDPDYSDVMKLLSKKLCGRTEELLHTIAKLKESSPGSQQIEQDVINLTKSSEKMYAQNYYYSSASYCYRANVAASAIIYKIQNPSKEELIKKINTINISIIEIENKIDAKKIESINDLQTYMIVKERIKESKDYINTAIEDLNTQNDTSNALNLLAFAGERLYSAVSWSEFFRRASTRFIFDDESLEESCKQKLSEAEERYNYINEILPGLADSIRDSIDTAFSDYQQSNFALCLFRASKAKAEVNVILNFLGSQENQIQEILQNKLSIAKSAIVEQQSHGIFPIVGYSYYEYATSLTESDPYSAMLFGEYALELSNLDIYFTQKKAIDIYIEPNKIWIFLFGLGIGIVITCYFLKSKEEDKDAEDKEKE